MPDFKHIQQTVEVTDYVNVLTLGLRYVEPPFDSQMFMSGDSDSPFSRAVCSACQRIMVGFSPVAEVWVNRENDVDCMLEENYRALLDGKSRYAPAAATAAARIVQAMAEDYPIRRVIVVGHGRIGTALFKLLDGNYPVVTMQRHNDLIKTDGVNEVIINCTPATELRTTNGASHVIDVGGNLGGGHIGSLTCAILARRAHSAGTGAIRQLEK